MYLALHRGGWAMQNKLGSLITSNMLTFHEIQATDYERLLGINRILTLDSDFFFYLINDSEPFNVINLNEPK